MAKYRPVDVRVWTDRKFNTLSDDGKLLWLFLLTTPSTLPIPGVIVGGPGALSEQLGWTVERFTKGLAELFRKGLGIRFDMASRLVWLTKAGAYQRASNENVFKGWAKTWDDIPECPLKLEIWQSIQASKQFTKLFAELFTKPFGNGLPNGQGQEQEQEQEVYMGAAVASAPADTKPAKAQASRAAPLPADWAPTQEHAALAASERRDLNREAARFRDWAANARPKKNWNAAFSNWLRNDYGQPAQKAPAQPKLVAVGAWSDAIDDWSGPKQ